MRRTSRPFRGRALLLAVPLVAGLLFGAGPANAIANGEPVADGKYTFSVKLTMTGIPTADGGRRDSACSGALIAPRWVITAGHCFRIADGTRVEYPVADLTTATVGRTALTTTTTGHVIKVVAVRQSSTADVALAQLATPVTDIEPVRIANQRPAIGAVARLTGYGSTNSVDPAPVNRLRTGQMSVASLSPSVIGMRGHAPKASTTPCPYDSGAPFFVEPGAARPILIAVVSNGPGCPHTEVENASRTDNIASWIATTVRAGYQG